MIGLIEIAVILGGLVLVCGSILWIWMLLDCANNEKAEGNEKLTWILIIVLTSWVGALISLLARRPKRIQELGK